MLTHSELFARVRQVSREMRQLAILSGVFALSLLSVTLV
jgi:hypothetical protein